MKYADSSVPTWTAQMHAGEPVPPEDPQPEEGRLEEEGRETFDRQRRAEDVADEP
jgi:hypothetical protein